MRRAAGRPKNVEGVELVTLDVAIEKAQEFLQLNEPPFTRRTLQNKISRGEFERYGTYHNPQVDWNEVKRALNWRKKRTA